MSIKLYTFDYNDYFFAMVYNEDEWNSLEDCILGKLFGYFVDVDVKVVMDALKEVDLMDINSHILGYLDSDELAELVLGMQKELKKAADKLDVTMSVIDSMEEVYESLWD